MIPPVDDDDATVTSEHAVRPTGHRQDAESNAAERFGHLFHLIGDAVVEIELVDLEPIVRAVNPAFEEIFGFEETAVLGRSLNDFIVPEDATESNEFDERTAAGKENIAIVERQTATGVREFLYRGVPYEGSDGGRYGFAIYADITEQRKYERHSRVVHRILRHNLRNDLSVMLVMAGEIKSLSSDPQVQEFAETIRRHATGLAAVGEETQTLERVLDNDESPRPIRVDRVCGEAVKEAETASVDVSVDAPPNLDAQAVPYLTDAVKALVDNAIRHGGEAPTVSVLARAIGDTVQIEVIDDGPGIPAQERATVFNGEAITQLQHGSGVGLWLVRWTVDACGGDLEYERTDDGRTIVRIVLRADPTTAS
jgi:PAS domain S-box-containing protein